jgi:LAS superfamily LD-carboxypeptidase LdcB
VATRHALGGTAPTVERTFAQFQQAVLEAETEHSKRRGREYFAPVPESDLEVVEGRFKLRKNAAKSCREMLAAARAALEAAKAAAAKAKKADRASKTRSIGICSAYRDYDDDLRAWRNAFKKHYDEMIETKKFVGHEHGKLAQQHMVTTLIPLKAPPGFSNHSNGTAVDFQTDFNGTAYLANSSQRDGWRTTWLHPWLVANAATYGFRPLSSEEWHWDHDA